MTVGSALIVGLISDADMFFVFFLKRKMVNSLFNCSEV